jgi:hypothetical protein
MDHFIYLFGRSKDLCINYDNKAHARTNSLIWIILSLIFRVKYSKLNLNIAIKTLEPTRLGLKYYSSIRYKMQFLFMD